MRKATPGQPGSRQSGRFRLAALNPILSPRIQLSPSPRRPGCGGDWANAPETYAGCCHDKAVVRAELLNLEGSETEPLGAAISGQLTRRF